MTRTDVRTRPAPWQGAKLHRARLPNGLEVRVLSCARAPVVSTALLYGAGAREDPPGGWGTAHFLEHMMFKGSPCYRAGEIDELTQSLGGSNNAFTSHDCAIYQFSFTRDRWQAALEVEADRMQGVLLEPESFEAERAVILEEISLHDDDPWDSLEQEVFRRLYDEHPYARPILGTREAIQGLTIEQLRGFHDRFYKPDKAVLAVAGDVGPEAFDLVELTFGELKGSGRAVTAQGERPRIGPASRIRRSSGEIPRLLMAMPGPAATEEIYAPLRLAAAILGLGRTSRLHRKLVDENQLLSSVSVDVTETVLGGAVLVAAEALPGSSEKRIEESIFEQIEDLSSRGPSPAELTRAKRLIESDWVFSHQQTHQRSTTVALAAGLFGKDYLERQLLDLREASVSSLQGAAGAYLRPLERAVIGWSRTGVKRR